MDKITRMSAMKFAASYHPSKPEKTVSEPEETVQETEKWSQNRKKRGKTEKTFPCLIITLEPKNYPEMVKG